MLEKKFYDTADGEEVTLYTLDDGFLSVDIVDRGARINAIRVGGTDVALGYDSVSDYIKSATYAGATVGRVANRIAKGRFTLGGKEYRLYTNNGENHLHGGKQGFDDKRYEYVESDGESLTLAYTSVDGEEGYPGTLTMRVKFTVKGGALTMDYSPPDGGLIPTGEKRAVAGTPFDFNEPYKIGERFGADELKATSGYDHNYILDGDKPAAIALGERTGIELTLTTDLPCMQLYTGGSMGVIKGKGGATYGKWGGFCLEPQYAPDAINQTAFEKPLLKKGEIKKHYIKYAFAKK